MKAVRITKAMLKKMPDALLIYLGAVNDDKTVGYPEHVYLSDEDYSLLEKNVWDYTNKELKGYSKKYKETQVGFMMLNYAPNQSLGKAIAPGYALIDFDSIKVELKRHNVGKSL